MNNSTIFRQKITNFDNLVKYTKKILKGKISYELLSNGNIITEKVCYHNFHYGTFYITENIEDRLNAEVLFWEKKSDRYNYFTSAGRLSRVVRKMFKNLDALEADRKFSKKRVLEIKNKINKI